MGRQITARSADYLAGGREGYGNYIAGGGEEGRRRRRGGGYAPYEEDTQRNEGQEMVERLFSGGGGGNSEGMERLLRAMAERWRPPETPGDLERTRAQIKNPEEYARRQYMAQQYAAPFAEGGAFQGRRAADVMTPEQILASQGNTAANQWAQMGGVKNINPATLQDLNAKIARQRAGSYRSYV